VTLSESQQKKASFLRECVRMLGLSIQVHLGRAESIAANFDCVALRAVDRMSDAVGAARALVSAGGWLAVMTTSKELLEVGGLLVENFRCGDPVNLPGGESRVLLLAQRTEVANRRS
jgi:16S rRNA (guanine527-N7)-methyltransferase